jgi:DNA repair protein SbcD/Mre11
MKILHTADWHLGRTLCQESLLDHQAALLDQIFDAVVKTQSDVLLIAGDIFDRPNPKKDAVDLFDRFLARVYHKTGAAIVAIAGNHDAPERIAFGAALQDPARVLIRGPLDRRAPPLVLNDEHGPVAFSALPFAEVYAAREAFEDAGISCPADVLKAQMGEARAAIPDDARWVVAAHAFVTGASPTESERPLALVGGIETVESDLFAEPAYSALGHLHRPQRAGADHVRYSGSCMAFGFDEAGQEKSMSLVILGEWRAAAVETLAFKPRRRMKVIEGTIAELIAEGRQAPCEDFIKAVLTDEGALVDPIGQLRAVYPNVLQIERKARPAVRGGNGGALPDNVADPAALISAFLKSVRRSAPSPAERALLDGHLAAIGQMEA